ncbi:MAG: RNA methyltransferase [Aquaticitalea sp.]
MLTKNQIKLIGSLSQKKFRNKHQLFVVEGKKGVTEFLESSFELYHLFSSSAEYGVENEKFTQITISELKKISNLATPNSVLALFKIPKITAVDYSKLILALDAVRDPGNLGTIIRLCDWFGIEHLVCSENTVDCYNPKVIQATMGSLTRVSIHYLDLKVFLKTSKVSIFGAFIEGANIYDHILPIQGILVMGNEANGISSEIETLIDKKISIPRFGNFQATESLNVATATGILLSEFSRR